MLRYRDGGTWENGGGLHISVGEQRTQVGFREVTTRHRSGVDVNLGCGTAIVSGPLDAIASHAVKARAHAAHQ